MCGRFTLTKSGEEVAEAFGLDVPWWGQYLNFWAALFHGDLGRSVWQLPDPVFDVIIRAVPYTLGLLIPAILLSFWAGNKVGALAARRRVLDNTVLPVGYVLTATPYMWLAIVLAYVFGSVLGLFPLSAAYSYSITPSWSWEFVDSYLYHSGRVDTTLPFDELRRRSLINDAAQAADGAPDFSERIRASLPTMPR